MTLYYTASSFADTLQSASASGRSFLHALIREWASTSNGKEEHGAALLRIVSMRAHETSNNGNQEPSKEQNTLRSSLNSVA